MKSLLSALLLSGLVIFSSCKKDDEPADPRNAFVGAYKMNGQCDTAGGKVDVDIEKDSNDANGLIITSSFFETFGLDEVEAEVSGNGFEIPSTNVSIVGSDGNTYTGKMEGEGTLDGKELTIDVEFSGNIDDACTLEGSK